jgi:hypothetical protein
MKTKIYLFSTLMIAASITSCSKKEGCTDATATNYDSAAESDDGSCTYRGKAVFWQDEADSLGERMIVMTNGGASVDVGEFADAPDCSSGFTIDAAPGTHTFGIIDGNGADVGNGSVIITANGCVDYQVTQ